LETGQNSNWIWTMNLSEALIAHIPPESFEDCPFLWMVVRSHTFILSTYLLMGAGRLITLLSWVPALFGPTNWRWVQVVV